MKEKKRNTKDWFNTGTKREVFVKKMLAVVFTIYFIYRLGYAIGTFLVYIDL